MLELNVNFMLELLYRLYWNAKSAYLSYGNSVGSKLLTKLRL